MSRAASRLSSVTSGLQTLLATISIATSYGVTTAPRRASSSHSPHSRRLAAPIRATSGSGWRCVRKTGAEILALAHNGNLSNGRMFPIIEIFHRQADRSRICREPSALGAALRSHADQGRWRDHPFLSPNDEFANFERWDKGNLDLTELKKPEMLEFEYARSALRNGLKIEGELGVNPYKFGLVGSTDAHTSLAAVEEDNFFGKTSSSEPSADRATHPFVKTDKAIIMGWEQTASGYAAVWATENTREAIFDAMKRRETYATTGPRMVVRFFGGWDFEAADANNRMPARIGYTKACRWVEI